MAEHKLSILVQAVGAAKAAKDLRGVDSAISSIGSRAGRGVRTAGANIAKLGVVAAGGIAVAVHSGIQSLAELESATTSVDGAIKQLGLTGQVTSAQVAGWANSIEADIGAAFDDKEITAATATLLRFGKVTPSNLQPAMQVMTDLAVKTGSVDSAASLLAKALADPTKAAGKLARSGVVLTKEQQKQIKLFEKAGDRAKAQQVILDALTETTKGAAAASQGPYQRALSILADTSEDARKALAEGFLPVITKVADLLQTELAKPSTMANIREFGTMLASGLDDLIDIAKNLPWGTIGDSLKIAGAGAKAVLGAFNDLPPWVQTAVLTGWGLDKLSGGALSGVVGELGKGLIKGVLGMNAGVVRMTAGAVTVSGPGIGGGGLPNALPGAAGGAGAAAGVGIATVATTVVVTAAAAAVIGTAIAGAIYGPKNQALKDKGLNQAEIAALNYYRADAATQATIQKRLGRIPSKADYQSALSKLEGKTSTSNDSLKDLKSEQAEARRITAQKLSEAKNATVETKRETAKGAALMSSTTRSASASNAATIGGFIRANRPVITTNISVNVGAGGITKNVNTHSSYGPPTGSAHTGHAPGAGPLP